MGPKWTFSVDAAGVDYVAYVDCDLANAHVPAGEANIAYSCHPAYRGKGSVSRAVRQVIRFLAEHTGCQEAHLLIDADNIASLRVAQSLAAEPVGSFVGETGRTMLRHVLAVER
jgi:RimJ/RimL family protein N-acetyltransferase